MSTVGRGDSRPEGRIGASGMFLDTPMSTSTLLPTPGGLGPSMPGVYARFYAGPKDLHIQVFKQLSANPDSGILLARVLQVCKQWKNLLLGPSAPSEALNTITAHPPPPPRPHWY